MLQKLFYVAYVTNKCLFSCSLPGFHVLMLQYLFGKGNLVIVWTILYIWRCYHVVRSVIKNKKKQQQQKKTTTKNNNNNKKKKTTKKQKTTTKTTTTTKNDRTHISFYIWYSYTSYIVCIGIVKCWSWSIYDDLGSTVCILTTNFDSKMYKSISLSLYDAVMLCTLHNN